MTFRGGMSRCCVDAAGTSMAADMSSILVTGVRAAWNFINVLSRVVLLFQFGSSSIVLVLIHMVKFASVIRLITKDPLRIGLLKRNVLHKIKSQDVSLDANGKNDDSSVNNDFRDTVRKVEAVTNLVQVALDDSLPFVRNPRSNANERVLHAS